MIDRGVGQSVSANASGRFSWLFDKIGPLATADILFGNLEGPVSDQGKNVGSQYSFRMDPEVIKALAAAGFDAVSVANNHAGDWSLAAFADTLKRLGGAKILAVGGGENRAAATAVKVIERDGLRYGFLGATDVGPNWLAAKAKQAGIVVASDPAWPDLIKQAASSVDFLIVSYHFGDEYQTTPNARQRQLAELAIDQGAKLVIGHHPHVIQPVERYGEGLIAYSLGNFIFDQYFSEATMNGAALVVEVVEGKVADFKILPVAISPKFQPVVADED
jgi:poly-gamma-glutamate synthesis protein (capsule biosynthesis protein)